MKCTRKQAQREENKNKTRGRLWVSAMRSWLASPQFHHQHQDSVLKNASVGFCSRRWSVEYNARAWIMLSNVRLIQTKVLWKIHQTNRIISKVNKVTANQLSCYQLNVCESVGVVGDAIDWSVVSVVQLKPVRKVVVHWIEIKSKVMCCDCGLKRIYWIPDSGSGLAAGSGARSSFERNASVWDLKAMLHFCQTDDRWRSLNNWIMVCHA